MTHSDVQARLSEHLERDLEPAERARIDAHLAECADCAGEARALRETLQLLRGLPDPAPPITFADDVMARLADGEGRPSAVFRLLQRAVDPRVSLPLAAGLAGYCC